LQLHLMQGGKVAGGSHFAAARCGQGLI